MTALGNETLFDPMNLPDEDMDHTLREPPSLCGNVELLSNRPVFNGCYSTVFRGRLKTNHEMVIYLHYDALRLTRMVPGRLPSRSPARSTAHH
jgi:hypothetical protein